MVTKTNDDYLVQSVRKDIKSIINCIEYICKRLEDGKEKRECLKLIDEYTNFYNEFFEKVK